MQETAKYCIGVRKNALSDSSSQHRLWIIKDEISLRVSIVSAER